MPSQSRVWWATEAFGIKPDGSTGAYTAVHGLQTVGITTNFNLQQFFEIGQAEIYENKEDLPDVEITLERLLDGYPLAYHLSTRGAPNGTLLGRSNQRCIAAMSVYSDTQDSASGTPLCTVHSSGMYVNSLGFNFTNEGGFTESVTLVGNNIVHKAGGTAIYGSTFSGTIFDNTDSPLALSGSGGVQTRENFIFSGVSTVTLLPTQIPGISSSGTNTPDAAGQFPVHVESISVSADFNRNNKTELGRRAPYARTINPPVEVTTEIQIVALSGAMVDATEDGALGNGSNLSNQTIKLVVKEGTVIDLGTKNKLQSWSWSGNDAGGGDASLSYTFVGYNTFTVTHPQDPG